MMEGGATQENEGCSSHACLISPPKGMGTNSGKCYCSQEKVRRHIDVLKLHVHELREALYALLRFATKPQPRDEEEQERVVAKVAKALKSAGKLAEDDAEEPKSV